MLNIGIYVIFLAILTSYVCTLKPEITLHSGASQVTNNDTLQVGVEAFGETHQVIQCSAHWTLSLICGGLFSVLTQSCEGSVLYTRYKVINQCRGQLKKA